MSKQVVRVIEEVTHSVVLSAAFVPATITGDGAFNVYQLRAAEAIGGHRIVYATSTGEAAYASNTNPECAAKVFGLTTNSAAVGGILNVVRSGEVEEPSWAWDTDKPVFLSNNGLLTQTQVSSGFSLIVGFPLTTTKLFVSIREPLFIL